MRMTPYDREYFNFRNNLDRIVLSGAITVRPENNWLRRLVRKVFPNGARRRNLLTNYV